MTIFALSTGPGISGVAIRGLGSFLLVNSLITFDVSGPEILITATPEIPGPVDRANIVINIILKKLYYIRN